MTWIDVIDRYYPKGSQVREILILHSAQVASLALEIAYKQRLELLSDDILAAAMLHDIGIIETNAPGIGCHGSGAYLQHGDIGGDMIRACDIADGEEFARVAERHTGAGITPEDIETYNLPLSDRSHMPQSTLEKLICYADKFFSKSSSMHRKTVDEVRGSMEKFGENAVRRFDTLREEFEPETMSHPDK